MKYNLIIIILFLVCACKPKPELKLQVNSAPTLSVKYDNKYYSFFEVNILNEDKSPTGLTKKYFYILSDDFKIENKIDLPENVDENYIDLFANHDSIFIKNYYDTTSFYLDEENQKWKEINSTDDVVFEDDKYYITALDFGEWGSRIWFKDKKTNVEYETSSSFAPEVIKLDGAYYIITDKNVDVVANPHKLKLSTRKSAYSYLRKDPYKLFSYDGYSRQGITELYEGDFMIAESRKFFIVKSFIKNKQLKHIIADDGKLLIATIEDGKLKLISTIGDNMYVYSGTGYYRNRNLNQALAFYSPSKKAYGYIEIKNGHVLLHYLKNLKSH